jgi:hypothetical protein
MKRRDFITLLAGETEGGKRPQPMDGGLARLGPLTQPAVVGEGACSIAFSQITFRADIA